MKKLSIALILATMAATLCMVGVELAAAERSEQFLKFFGVVSFLILDLFALVSIFRDSDK